MLQVISWVGWSEAKYLWESVSMPLTSVYSFTDNFVTASLRATSVNMCVCWTFAAAESYLWLIYKSQQAHNWHCCWALWGHPGIWMRYLLKRGIGSLLSAQGHRKPISASQGSLPFGGSWEQRCISAGRILMIDSTGWSAVFTCADERKSRAVLRRIALTRLPSFCQKTAGWGFPLASHGKVAVRPWATIWSLGRMTNCGAAEDGGEKKKSISRLALDCTYKDKQGLGISGKDKQYTPQLD